MSISGKDEHLMGSCLSQGVEEGDGNQLQDTPVPMLVKGGPHQNIDEDATARCDQHRLWLDLELLANHPKK